MNKIYASIKENTNPQAPPKIHLILDLESIQEASGVTELQQDPSQLFKTCDIIEIVQNLARVAGRQHLGSMSLTDYNPIIEDQRTGRSIAMIFYHLCIGLCQHKI